MQQTVADSLDTTIGRYPVWRRVGRGGMGEVYRATEKALGRHVALKALRPAPTRDLDRSARFAAEAR